MSAWISFLFGPRGLFGVILYLIVLVPLTVIQCIGTSQSALFKIVVSLFGFIVGDRDFERIRMFFKISDGLEWAVAALFVRTERVRRKFHSEFVEGVWIFAPNEYIPNWQSQDWKRTKVLFWIHGGGFSSGSCFTGAFGLQKIIQHFPLFSDDRLVIFSCEYPLAPKSKHAQQVDACLVAYRWLIEHVGAINVVLVSCLMQGGDSSGGNLALAVYSNLERMNAKSGLILPQRLVLISPWLDVSLSHTPPHVLKEREATDLLSMAILYQWRDNVAQGNLRDRHISPFFALEPVPMPPRTLVIYGSAEMFGPTCEEWIRFMSKYKEMKVILGQDMPHSYPMILHPFPTKAHGPANRALIEISRFIS